MKKLRVLYIEDNAENCLLVRRLLEAEGFQVDEARDGTSGIHCATTRTPNLILIDIMMPGLNGREVTTRLRAVPSLVRTPIVALTASVLHGDRERAVAAGCDGYMAKPIDVDRFTDQLREFLAGRRESLSPEEELHYLREHNKRLAERLEQKVTRLSEISETNKRLTDMSLTDELTGLPNRRYLNRRLREEVAMARRFQTALSVIMIDLDYFKQINDSQGHAAGDAILQSLASLLQSGKREYEIVGRFGGEEFLLLLPQVGTSGALAVAERLREQVANKRYTTGKNQTATVTISLGIACLNGEATSEAELIRRADEALYQSKQAGRNCCRLWQTWKDS